MNTMFIKHGAMIASLVVVGFGVIATGPAAVGHVAAAGSDAYERLVPNPGMQGHAIVVPLAQIGDLVPNPVMIGSSLGGGLASPAVVAVPNPGADQGH